MDTLAGPYQGLLALFKALADDTRLRIVIMLRDREMMVSEIAAELGLSEPTISHHLGLLREIGLLTLRADGTSRCYRFNGEMWERWKTLLIGFETLDFAPPARPDTAWIDALSGFADWERKVLKDYWNGTRFSALPAKEKKLAVIVRYAATRFEPGRTYTEQEVSARLKELNDDYALLRRELVERGYLTREGGGGVYWVTQA